MKKEKMNDKGFSLVELIIVIAIMAVLVIVLAPQYLKYVEKSRNSTDVSNATAIVTACQVWAADPDAGEGSTKAFTSGDTFEIKVTNSGGTTASDAVKSALTEAAIDIAKTKSKSKNEWDAYTIKGTVKTDGSIEFTYESTVGTDTTDNGKFSTAMNK